MGIDEREKNITNIRNLDFPHIYKVNASAGSGKTEALSDRFIKLLMSNTIENSYLPNIIALTFTNKAVMEMKKRILEKLKGIYFGNSENAGETLIEEVMEMTGYSIEELKKYTEIKIDRIIEDYTHFQVKTIDSMISYISKISASDMRLSPDFELNFNPNDSIDYAIDLLVSDFKPGDDFYEKIMDFVMFVVETGEKYSWRPVDDIKREVRAFVKLLNTKGVKPDYEELRTDRINELKKRVKKSAEKIKKIASDEGIKLNANIRKRLNKMVEGRLDIKNRKICEDCLLNKAERDRYYLFAAAVDEMNKGLKDYCEFLAQLKGQKAAAFLEGMEAKIDEFIRKKGTIALSELTTRLKDLLREEYIPEIFYKLGNTYYHYLVDEFQDTSRVQWHIIEKLIENVIAEKGSLFYVGDVKQAIYRFRGGDISLFSEIINKYKDRVKCYEQNLGTNFRSAKVIVEFNNEVFGKDRLKRFVPEGEVLVEQVLDVYKDVKQSPRDTKERGYVRVERCNDKDEILNEKVPAIIEGILKRKYTEKDICILTRTNDEGEKVANTLMEKGYTVVFDKIAKINENSIINEIISFLKFLNNPADNLSFYSFISGKIFLLKTDLNIGKINDFAFDNRGKSVKYRAFREEFPEVWEKDIAPFLMYVNYLPLYDIIVEIIKHFDVIESIEGSEAYLMKLLEVIKDMSEKGELSIDEIMAKWRGEENRESESDKFNITIPEYTDAIKIMTVNKAKGLAFPIVILPFSFFNDGNHQSKEIYTDNSSNKTVFYKIKKSCIEYSDKLARIYKEEKTRSFIDKLNKLYVAMTRAKDMMFILTIKENRKNAKKIRRSEEDRFFFPDEGKSINMGEPVFKENGDSERKTLKNEENSYPKAETSWHDNLAFHGEDVIFERDRRDAIARGDLFHKVLEEIKILNPDKIEPISGKLSAKYGLFKDEIKDILNFITGDEFLMRFYTGGVEIFNEKDMVTANGDVYRVDRLVIRDDTIYIIDYKTGERYSDKHRKQIKRYIDIAREIYGMRCVGVLLYLDEKRKVVIDG